MGKREQKITYETIKYVSDYKLKQMYQSYMDWTKKNNHSLGNMNMYCPLKIKISIVVDECLRRLAQKWKKEQKQ